jgi:hypothetical protein
MIATEKTAPLADASWFNALLNANVQTWLAV